MQTKELTVELDYSYLNRLSDYKTYLQQEGRSENTISKYLRDLQAFRCFLSGQPITKEKFLFWKEQLTVVYAPTSVNSMLAAVNNFLDWLGFSEMKVKPLKIQREIFAKPERELTIEEYKKLVTTAEQKKNYRLSLLLQTICATGIRVSELKFITVNSILTRRATVACKGKTRTVFLPVDLCRALKEYCKKQGIKRGVIFRTKNGKTLDRSNIWKEMKALCKDAGVESGKVFPHNLRHLFARTFYGLEKDIARLADLLGHSNIATTRIYTMESGKEHEKQINRMKLILSQNIKTTT